MKQHEPVGGVTMRTDEILHLEGKHLLATAGSELREPTTKHFTGYSAGDLVTVSFGRGGDLINRDRAYLPAVIPLLVKQYAESDEMVARIAAKVSELMRSHDAGGSLAPAGAVNPLAAARARGRDSMRALLDAPDNLSLAEAATAAGASERHVNSLRDRGRLYALVLDGSTRGYRYPEWQFAADPRRLQPVLAALANKGLSCWAIHEFMCRRHPDLKQPPRDAILDDTVDINNVVNAVGQRFSEADQGAA